MGVMVVLLLYADDLILMSESAAGLSKPLQLIKLDALASLCDICQHRLKRQQMSYVSTLPESLQTAWELPSCQAFLYFIAYFETATAKASPQSLLAL